MLRRIGPRHFEAPVGDGVTLVAIAQNNNGVESAVFQHGSQALVTRTVQGHPGCDFVVVAGPEIVTMTLLFDPAVANARYDLFEEDDLGNLIDLQVAMPSAAGPAFMVQIDGVQVPVLAAAKKAKAKRAKAKKAKATAKKTTAKKKVNVRRGRRR